MPEIKKGSFCINLGVFRMQAEVSEEDRQCAWELYTELCTRLAMTGKLGDPECKDYNGEILAESLQSVHQFFQEARSLMRSFPVGRLSMDEDKHLGSLIHELMVNVLRPFLERWQSDLRYWWENQADERMPPSERQRLYPHYRELLEDWTNLRILSRELMYLLAESYRLPPIQR